MLRRAAGAPIKTLMNELRNLPSVETLLNEDQAKILVKRYGRTQTLNAIRETLDEIRQTHTPGRRIPDSQHILLTIEKRLSQWFQPTLVGVINATGVILHTNLGRAPLSLSAYQAMQDIACGYNTLEFDMSRGKRGSRSVHAEAILTRLTGAEAATIVNNNASAVLLALSSLAKRRKVVIARTQLIEIGGGFRIPDVMKQSGAKLVEVGTTNRVHIRDYEEALQEPVGLVMRAHHSNFKLLGFTHEPSLEEIITIAHRYGVSVMDDLGSGTLLDTSKYGLTHEPTIQESVEAGADLISFSGDKLLGGPQAGILIGNRDLIAKIKKHPLARAVRPDKLCLAALTETLLHYLRDEAEQKIPIWRMMGAKVDTLKTRAEHWQQAIGNGEVVRSQSTIGGGSLPEETLPTYVLKLEVRSADSYLKKMRGLQPAIIGRIEENAVYLDPRTVLPEQDETLINGLKQIR